MASPAGRNSKSPGKKSAGIKILEITQTSPRKAPPDELPLTAGLQSVDVVPAETKKDVSAAEETTKATGTATASEEIKTLESAPASITDDETQKPEDSSSAPSPSTQTAVPEDSTPTAQVTKEETKEQLGNAHTENKNVEPREEQEVANTEEKLPGGDDDSVSSLHDFLPENLENPSNGAATTADGEATKETNETREEASKLTENRAKSGADLKKKKKATSLSPKPKNPKRQSTPSTVTTQEKAKPLMDLRHILKKHEKKVEKPQPLPEVDFYGSMSAIPFLKQNNATKTEKKKKKGTKQSTKKASFDETGDKKEQVDDVEALLLKGEKRNSNGVIIIKDYTEDQLKLWKSMSALDAGDLAAERPPDMLPLMPAGRPKKLTPVDRSKHAERSHNRPDEWLNPHLKTPEKLTYKVKVEDKHEIPFSGLETSSSSAAEAKATPPSPSATATTDPTQTHAVTVAIDKAAPKNEETNKTASASKKTDDLPMSPKKGDSTEKIITSLQQDNITSPKTGDAKSVASSVDNRLHDSMASVSSRGSYLSHQDETYKAMSNADFQDMSRPVDMLPLTPGQRKKRTSNKHKGIVGQGRPTEWLSPKEKAKSPITPTIRIKREMTPEEVSKGKTESNVEGLQTMPML